MGLRFVEIRLPAGVHEEAAGLVESHEIIDEWYDISGEQEAHRYLVQAERVEALVDAMRARFGEDVRIVVMPVEATMPRPDAPVVVPIEEPIAPTKMPNRVSREELYEDVGERVLVTPVFMILAGVSALVACIGLARDDTIALIAAMVIAPLLGPNVGLALASTLGDLDLGRKSLKAGGVGIAISFLVAVGYGWMFGAPDSLAIAERVSPSQYSIVLALASGVAGGMAFTTGVPASLIGVMVAVALLPPLAAGGMLLGAGDTSRSAGAFILLGVNLVAVNLAGVATFLGQGIRPVWNSEQRRASRAAKRALIFWSIALVALAIGVWWVRN